jgi:pSer/pThr/pTyr-binding forkhead associated (FHA) protein
MRASLIPLNGGSAIEILKDITVIGRKDFCDVKLDDPSVSKVHLLIAKTDGLLLFRDMGSTNGTKVNGQRVIRGALLPNDKLQIAAVKYQVQLLPDEPSTAHEAASVVTPPGEDAAAVRVYRAQELARPIPVEAQAARGTSKPEGIVETDEEARSARPADADRIASAAPSNEPNRSAPGSAPQFVD